jgi:ATP-binding cassette, subfamily C (CFTR/MRP), member 1
MSEQDNVFGPQLRGSFDFTVLFEQSILSIAPTALFVVLAPFRIAWLLRRRDACARSGRLLWLKLVFPSVCRLL